MKSEVLVCVFAKPPRPGEVKTRLAAAVGDVNAARLAGAFLKDTWNALAALRWARPVLATTKDDGDGFGLPEGVDVWLQGHGDLGERLERIIRRGLSEIGQVVVVGADSPGLPERIWEGAREGLETKEAVLAPCDDGGFSLLGLKLCPQGLLAGLPWSQPTTFEATRSRIEERGISVRVLDRWFDVDRPADLNHLRAMIERQVIRAPATARVLEALGGVSFEDRMLARTKSRE